MSPPTTFRRWPATALAALCAGASAYIILDDVIHGAQFTTVHLASLVALVVAIGAGRYAWPALRQGSIAAGLILAVVFVGATGYIVVASGMRNAEVSAARMATGSKVRDDRARADAEWRRIDAELTGTGAARSTSAVRAAMDAVVGAGEGKVPVRVFTGTKQCTDITKPASAEACRPLLALRIEMADAIRRAELEPKAAAARARLEAMPAAPPADSGYRTAARVLVAIACLTGCEDAAKARRIDATHEALGLVMPFLSVLLTELGGIGFALIGHGGSEAGNRTRIGHRPAVRALESGQTSGQSDGPALVETPVTPALPAPVAPGQTPGQSAATLRKSRTVAAPDAQRRTDGRRAKDEALADLVTELALGRSVPSQTALAQRWHRPKQTVSDWLREWERAGLIPARRQSGREKGIAAA